MLVYKKKPVVSFDIIQQNATMVASYSHFI